MIHVGDFSALHARKYLIESYGLDLSIEDPGCPEEAVVLGGIGRFVPGTTPDVRLAQAAYYENAAYTQAIFFAQAGRKPPEHGDISF